MFHKTILLDWVDFWPVPLPKPLHTRTTSSTQTSHSCPQLRRSPYCCFLCPFSPSTPTSWVLNHHLSPVSLHYTFRYAACENSSPSTSPFQYPFPKTESKEMGGKEGRWTEVLLLPYPELLIDFRVWFGWDLIREKIVSVLTLSGTLTILSVSSQLWNGLMALIMPSF